MSNKTETSEAVSSEKSGGQFVFGTWYPMTDAPRDRPILVFTNAGHVVKCAWTVIGDDAEGWGTVSEDDLRPNSWTDGFCWASNEDEEPSDEPIAWTPYVPPSIKAKSEERE